MPIAKLALDHEILKLFTADQMLFGPVIISIFTQFEGLPGLKIGNRSAAGSVVQRGLGKVWLEVWMRDKCND
ncbi:MAG: hypothetical protein IPO92_03765 [Saprospiraceae bacterium]|nr:hypothetical protein [Saprospiraceae bacterium]